jgi:hypothetical protein
MYACKGFKTYSTRKSCPLPSSTRGTCDWQVVHWPRPLQLGQALCATPPSSMRPIVPLDQGGTTGVASILFRTSATKRGGEVGWSRIFAKQEISQHLPFLCLELRTSILYRIAEVLVSKRPSHESKQNLANFVNFFCQHFAVSEQ